MFGKDATLAALAEKEIELLARKRAVVITLQAAEAAAGNALLGESDGAAELQDVIRLRADINATDTAIATLRSRRADAIKAESLERSSVIRKEAETKRKELGTITGKTAAALKNLSEAQQVSYTEWILSAQPATDDARTFFRPRSLVLRDEIQALEQKADELASSAVPAQGHVELDGVNDDKIVVLAVLNHPSASPSAEFVEEFLRACASDRRIPNRSFGNLQRRVWIAWRDGVIDVGQSSVFVASLARPQASTYGLPVTGTDVNSATFRASA
jgi:hypothetical protein